MLNTISNLSSFNNIGRVSDYAKNLTNSYLKTNGLNNADAVKKLTQSTESLYGTFSFGNSFSVQSRTNLNMLKSAADRLSSAARMLNNGSYSLVSGDQKVVSTGGKIYSGLNSSIQVEVNNLATKQESLSAKFDSDAVSGFEEGLHSLTLRTEHGSYNVQFEIKQDDTGETALGAIANSINNAKSGVTASVVTEEGKSSLKLTSDNTGVMSAFVLEGDAAQALAITDTKKAIDARYTIDGKSYLSGSNTVKIRQGHSATMTLEGTGSTTIRQSADTSALVQAAKVFASAYNSSVSYLTSDKSASAGMNKALLLITDNRMTAASIGNYGGYAAARLSSMGITIDKDGIMQIDEEKLSNAAAMSPNTVKTALAGYGGLAERTSYNAAQAMRLPVASYTNFNYMGTQNGLLSALMPRSGYLFDFFM